jgi:hypothetical protein
MGRNVEVAPIVRGCFELFYLHGFTSFYDYLASKDGRRMAEFQNTQKIQWRLKGKLPNC